MATADYYAYTALGLTSEMRGYSHSVKKINVLNIEFGAPIEHHSLLSNYYASQERLIYGSTALVSVAISISGSGAPAFPTSVAICLSFLTLSQGMSMLPTILNAAVATET